MSSCPHQWNHNSVITWMRTWGHLLRPSRSLIYKPCYFLSIQKNKKIDVEIWVNLQKHCPMWIHILETVSPWWPPLIVCVEKALQCILVAEHPVSKDRASCCRLLICIKLHSGYFRQISDVLHEDRFFNQIFSLAWAVLEQRPMIGVQVQSVSFCMVYVGWCSGVQSWKPCMTSWQTTPLWIQAFAEPLSVGRLISWRGLIINPTCLSLDSQWENMQTPHRCRLWCLPPEPPGLNLLISLFTLLV